MALLRRGEQLPRDSVEHIDCGIHNRRREPEVSVKLKATKPNRRISARDLVLRTSRSHLPGLRHTRSCLGAGYFDCIVHVYDLAQEYRPVESMHQSRVLDNNLDDQMFTKICKSFPLKRRTRLYRKTAMVTGTQTNHNEGLQGTHQYQKYRDTFRACRRYPANTMSTLLYVTIQQRENWPMSQQKGLSWATHVARISAASRRFGIFRGTDVLKGRFLFMCAPGCVKQPAPAFGRCLSSHLAKFASKPVERKLPRMVLKITRLSSSDISTYPITLKCRTNRGVT